MFKLIGLNIPKHVITQLSIGKTGVAPTFLYNLRACLTLFGANTNIIPQLSLPVIVRPPIFEDQLWLKYNLRYNLLQESPKYLYPNEYDFLWQKKQAERLMKTERAPKLPLISPTDSRNNSSPRPAILKLPKNPYFLTPTVSEVNLTAAKLELDDKTKTINQKEDELQSLKDKLKRMEVLISNKNARIQELTSRVEKMQPVKKK